MSDLLQPSPTLEDVARAAGLSRSTVSRVINGTRNFDPAVREAVQRAIAATGYVPNLAARSLVGSRTGTVALVVSGAGDPPDGDENAHQREVFADPFFGRVANGVTRFLRPRGVHPVLISAETDEDHRHVLAYLKRGNADGAILVSTHADDPLPALFPGTGLHAVLFARPARPLPISYVDIAHQEGAALAAEHLLARGCRRVATICGPLDVPAAQDRLAGFRTAMARHGYPYIPHVEGIFTLESGETATGRLLDEYPEVDGIFAANDLMAQGALLTLRDRGRRVPEDVAVVGFDDSSAAVACRPMLTTVRQPVEDMAAEMTRMLLDHIEKPNQPIGSRIFDPVLIVRQSA
ncbi:MAG TPA: LacI family DNA-binding transcriptional regulator [Actinocrinis sp.]|jgi:DNA-binding LacI/PurR family transcriptional regulator|uniref:LacI family DNA-binding transcriptional regulator n=1 Tax=Actinocrinis sp. TaxID=1920516 RepID=UPI002DDDA0DD|nr:LacI family DNA-binding transcriptional regulator [Actinocrinis sp.]HEV3173038.1 LacI family DNA-binding transcriptional regulator [Actinocrinis sp.]